MGVVRLKEGTTGFPVLRPAGIRILAALDDAAVVLDLDLVITSGSEARGRKPSDPHSTGEAADVRTMGLASHELLRLHRALKYDLGPAFTVLYEVPASHMPTGELAAIAYPSQSATAPHLHIQRKAGTRFPPDVIA